MARRAAPAWELRPAQLEPPPREPWGTGTSGDALQLILRRLTPLGGPALLALAGRQGPTQDTKPGRGRRPPWSRAAVECHAWDRCAAGNAGTLQARHRLRWGRTRYTFLGRRGRAPSHYVSCIKISPLPYFQPSF